MQIPSPLVQYGLADLQTFNSKPPGFTGALRSKLPSFTGALRARLTAGHRSRSTTPHAHLPGHCYWRQSKLNTRHLLLYLVPVLTQLRCVRMCPDREFDRLHRATRLRCGQHTTMLGSIGLPAELGHRRLRCMHVPDVPSFVNAITTLQRGTIPLMKVRRLSPPLRRTVEPQESWREDGSTPWLRCDPSIWISQSACVSTRGEAGSV